MNEDFEMKKAWLRRYQESIREEQLLMEEIEQLKATAARVTSCLSITSGSGRQDNRLPPAVEKIVNTQHQLQRQINYTYTVRTEINEKINTVNSSQEREILRRRYILGQKWEKIAYTMHVDYRWVTRLHKRVVETLQIKTIDVH